MVLLATPTTPDSVVLPRLSPHSWLPYPDGALQRGETGRVEAEILVSRDSNVLAARIYHAESDELAASAARTLRGLRLIPAHLGDSAVAAWVGIALDYDISYPYDRSQAFDTAEFSSAHDAMAIRGKVVVRAYIDETGTLSRFSLLNPDHPMLKLLALKAVPRLMTSTVYEEYPGWISIPLTFDISGP